MAKKDFILPLGERKVNPEGTDVLLSSKISERKRKEIERAEEKDEAKHRADMAELKKKEKSATTETEKVEKKAEVPESPVKITGDVSLGHIDFQKEREEATAELKRMKQEADEAGKGLAQENMQLREKIHEQEIKVLETTLKAQIQEVTKAIESNASKKTFMEQFNEAKQTAEALGMAHPSPETGDLQTKLSLERLKFDQTVELRRLSKEERAEARNWQLELRRLDDERDARKGEAVRQAKRDEMFANAPAVIGGALAKGLMETGGEGVSGAPKGKAGQHVEAGVGEIGDFECSSCGQKVAIGPTARTAVCSNCGTRFPIKRVEAEVAPEEE